MSTEKKPPPSDLPPCACFQTGSDKITWGRCCDLATAMARVNDEFHRQVELVDACEHALPYAMDLLLVGLLAYAAKAQAPAVEYGSQEIEWESERLLLGMEARVLARLRESYARSRALGLTQAKVDAMRAEERS